MASSTDRSKPMSKLTWKQRVLKSLPGSKCVRCRYWMHSMKFEVVMKVTKPLPQFVIIGQGETEDEAWADTARRIGGRK